MSFLTRTQPLARQTLLRAQAPRLFSTAVVYNKGPVDAVKDGLKKVDRAVSDAAVAGIDKGIEVKDQAAAAAGVDAQKAKGDAAELAGQAKGKASELAGQAKGKAEELKGEAKAKM